MPKVTLPKPAPHGSNTVNYMQQKADAERAARNRKAAPTPPASTAKDSGAKSRDMSGRDSGHTWHPDHHHDAGWRDRHGYDSPYDYGSPYGYGSRYGYDPYYGSGYSPYGVTGYVVGLSPYGYPAYGYGYGSPYAYATPYGLAYPYNYSPYGYRHYEYSPYAHPLFSVYPGALFMPAEQLFGPGPVQRMMGVDHGFNRPAAVAAEPVAESRRVVHEEVANDLKPATRDVSGKATALAWRYITFGDAHFANQKYSDAYERYRKASQQSPKVADTWFRQGLALAAMGQYERASKAIKRGLEFKPDWANSDFTLDEVYRGDAMSKKARLDAMLKAADDDPNNGDLSFLLGVHFYFDGKRDRAAPFFRRAADVLGTDSDVKAFLRE